MKILCDSHNLCNKYKAAETISLFQRPSAVWQRIKILYLHLKAIIQPYPFTSNQKFQLKRKVTQAFWKFSSGLF